MEVHILNGDALKEKFPTSIGGELIVARECLVDGNVSGKDLSELFINRQIYLGESYGISQGEYQKSIQEFERIKSIDSDSIVNLWFENDLFCQVNLWFCAYLLNSNGISAEIFLVQPNTELQYGFGGMNEYALIKAYNKKCRIKPESLSALSQLWRCYQLKNVENILKITKRIANDFPLIRDAVIAYIESIPTQKSPGRPKTALMEIIKRLGTNAFEPVFQEFSKSECIYGFGDLQVKRLMKELNQF